MLNTTDIFKSEALHIFYNIKCYHIHWFNTNPKYSLAYSQSR